MRQCEKLKKTVRQRAAKKDRLIAKKLKSTRGKRKAVEEESWDSSEPPSETQQNDLSVCGKKFGKLPFPGKFMRLPQIFQILRQAEKGFESVPSGEKNNVFYVIEDFRIVLRRERNFPAKYVDGFQEMNNCDRHGGFYVIFIGGKIVRVKLKDSLVYMPVYNNNNSAWKLIKPQPDLESLIKVNRYYTDLSSGDAVFKRRVTGVTGKDFKDRALFEYCTIARKANGPSNSRVLETSKESKALKPKPQNELNSRDKGPFENSDTVTTHFMPQEHTKTKEYRCVSPEVFEENKDGIKPIDIVDGEIPEYSEEDTPMNRQTPFTAVRMQQEVSSKVLDEDLVMMAMLEENPNVQAVINTKNKLPCVILYDEQQFSDMKRNLECGSVLGIDCTYKFEDCYATMTVYQNSRALHQETYEPLLYLGPVFLHWDDEFLTYLSFFSHIMDKLEDTKPNFEVKLGKTLEFSLFRALKHAFPTSVHMVNSHHLKNLVHSHLADVANSQLKTCLTVLQKIFGPTGIVNSPSLSAFQNRILGLECYFDNIPSLKTYLHELQLFLYPYVCEPQQRGISQQLWLNGNDEVLNELLQTFLNHKDQKLPDIVEKICTVSRQQMLKLDNM